MSNSLYNEETTDKQGESSSNQLPNEEKRSVAAPEDNISSESENDEDEDEEGDGGKGEGKEGVATRGSNTEGTGSVKTSPPLSEYVVNVVSWMCVCVSLYVCAKPHATINLLYHTCTCTSGNIWRLIKFDNLVIAK